MGIRTAAVDKYIAKAPEFARPILERIREDFHAGCPDIEEKIKWGHASFEYKGMLGGMAAFKKHVSFGFWKSKLMGSASIRERVESPADLPPKKQMVAWVREARRLNDDGVKPVRARPKRPAEVVVPEDLTAALKKSAKARKTFEGFAPSHKRDYVEWIAEAKREETRTKRLATTIAWLEVGKHRNWKYE